MVTSCEIKFDNSANNTFMSGLMVTGRIILNLTEKKKIRCKFYFFVNSAIMYLVVALIKRIRKNVLVHARIISNFRY